MRWFRRLAGVWGPMSFAVASVLAARRHPGYSHVRSHVSGLAAHGAPAAPVMVSGFAALGTASLVMDAPGPAVRRLLRAAGVATLGAGAFRASTPACPTPFVDAEVETTDMAHAGASMAAFVCWAALPVATARSPGPSWYRRLSSVLAVAAAVTYSLAGVTTRRHAPTRGLAQRAFLATIFLWYAATTCSQQTSSMDAVVQDVLAAIDRGAWDDVKRLLHPYLHWTDQDGRTIRGRKNVMAHLAETPPSVPPARHELRDGQIYRWVDGA